MTATNTPRLLQTYLPDGSIEGVRIIELSESSVKAFVVPRIKLNSIKNREEVNWPSFYLLINSGDNQLYIGESEKLYDRIKNHDQTKNFWDFAIAIVSKDNSLEKSDVKYLESMAIEKAHATAAMEVTNKTIPPRNNVHEFKVHSLEKILEDVALIAESLGFSIFKTQKLTEDSMWYITTKKSSARAEYRGNKFVVLSGSRVDKTAAPSWIQSYPEARAERDAILSKGIDRGGCVELTENIAFESPNKAGVFVTGRSINAWTTWKSSEGKTMDEVIRKGEV